MSRSRNLHLMELALNDADVGKLEKENDIECNERLPSRNREYNTNAKVHPSLIIRTISHNHQNDIDVAEDNAINSPCKYDSLKMNGDNPTNPLDEKEEPPVPPVPSFGCILNNVTDVQFSPSASSPHLDYVELQNVVIDNIAEPSDTFLREFDNDVEMVNEMSIQKYVEQSGTSMVDQNGFSDVELTHTSKIDNVIKVYEHEIQHNFVTEIAQTQKIRLDVENIDAIERDAHLREINNVEIIPADVAELQKQKHEQRSTNAVKQNGFSEEEMEQTSQTDNTINMNEFVLQDKNVEKMVQTQQKTNMENLDAIEHEDFENSINGIIEHFEKTTPQKTNAAPESSPTKTSPAKKKKKRIRNQKKRLEYDKKNHSMLEACSMTCRNKCRESISEDERKSVWDLYWSMDRQRRRDFIGNHVKRVKPATKSSKKSSRNFTLIWKLANKKVCKNMFLRTIGYKNDQVVQCVLKANYRMGLKDTSTSFADMRGKHKPSNAFPDGYANNLEKSSNV